MRIKHSLFNVQSNMFMYVFRTIMSFVVRTLFIKVLGEYVLGLDGLYSNILYILSVAELGVSSAISYSLYEPLAKNDTSKISSLMSFYRIIYSIIGGIILIIGIALIPFLHLIIKDVPDGINIYVIFILYLFDTVLSYFVSYKETLIYADQKNYKLTLIYFLTYSGMFIFQIISIVCFKNYFLYIVSRIVFMALQRIISNYYVSNNYKNIDFYTKKKIDKEEKNKIKTNIKGMFLYKIGNSILNGTDNIIISLFLNLSLVGLYSNYLSLVLMVDTMLSSVYKGIASSFGNLIVEEDNITQENVFRKINFLGHFLYGLVFVGYYALLDNFIELWVGAKFILPLSITFIICLNFYINGIKNCTDSIKEASGLYDQDKYMSIIQAIINVIVSVVLVQKIGLIGVVIGTLVSYVLIPCWNRPYILYKYLFNMNPIKYYLNYVLNIAFVIATGIFARYIIHIINIPNSIVGFICNVLIVGIIYVILFILIYMFSDDFKYYFNMIKNFIHARIGKHESKKTK